MRFFSETVHFGTFAEQLRVVFFPKRCKNSSEMVNIDVFHSSTWAAHGAALLVNTTELGQSSSSRPCKIVTKPQTL